MIYEEESTGRKGQKGRHRYDSEFRLKVAKEYIECNLSLPQLGQKYGIDFRRIHEWVKRYGPELVPQIIPSMTEEEQKDIEALKKQIETLKGKLEYEQMKNFAWETMADLAKTELGIDIRKNSGAKQPKE